MQETLTIILEPTPQNYATAFVDVAEGPAETSNRLPYQLFRPAQKGGLHRHKVSRNGPKRRTFTRERVLLGAFHCGPGLEPGIWGSCTVRHGTFEQRLNLI